MNFDSNLLSLDRLAQHLSRAEQALRRHPRRLTAVVAGVLLGSAFTAFGVAPLTRIETLPPIDAITHEVEPPDFAQQLEQLSERQLTLARSELTRAGDTVDTLLRRLGIDDAEAAQFLRREPLARQIFEGRARKSVQAANVVDAHGRTVLQQLVVRGPAEGRDNSERHFTRLSFTRDAQGSLHAHSEQVALVPQVQVGSGRIETSLFAAADEVGLPDAITAQMAELFGTDIDFRRDLRRGDSFTVTYETLTADGEPVSWSDAAGRVLSARFVNRGEAHEAVWFEEPGAKGNYFSLDGRSKAHFFLASPLAFSRVTSGFAMRFHPLLHKWRQHAGIDYAAPTGAPVRSVGDGVVEFAGRQGGYGNVIHVRHPGDRLTVYAHLSRIDVQRGERIAQNDVIGAVGATGWATGPHLHFEFRVKGEQVDPMTIARSSEATTVSAAARARFAQVAALVRAQWSAAAGRGDATHIARND